MVGKLKRGQPGWFALSYYLCALFFKSNNRLPSALSMLVRITQSTQQ